MNDKYISDYTIRRLPKYLRKLQELIEQDVKHISSKELGKLLDITPSQIRYDLSRFGEFGRRGYGYNVNYLSDSIKNFYGLNFARKAVIIGVGNIGRALIENFDFEKHSIQLMAAFDSDTKKIGTAINGINIYSLDEAIEYIATNEITLVVLAVPVSVSQEVTDMLKNSGIDAIWNFTNVDIIAGYDIIVENVNFSDSLLFLRYYVNERHKNVERKDTSHLSNPD